MKCFRFVFTVLMLGLAISVAGCANRKLIVKDCEKAENSNLYICSSI